MATPGGGNLLVVALKGVTDQQTSTIPREALDEFIRQLFACNWVLRQVIARLLERARSESDDATQAPVTDDAYSMIRSAIREVVDRNGPRRIEAATNLMDEVLNAISDDSTIFPADPAVTTRFPDRDSRRPRVRRRR
jgi:hypothetical protein